MDKFGGPIAFGGFDVGKKSIAFGGLSQNTVMVLYYIEGIAFGVPMSHSIPSLRA